MTPDTEDATLKEPLTELTAEMSVDIFDGNLVLLRTGWDGMRGFRLALAGAPDARLGADGQRALS